MISSKALILPGGVRSLWTSRRKFATAAAADETANEGASRRKRMDEEEYEMTIKRKILDASLKYVHEMGWSRRAIAAGAESIGYPGVTHGLFPHGGAELVNHLQVSCNEKLARQLEEATRETTGRKPQPVERFICDALKSRLRMILPYKEKWPQALALSSQPQNLPTALRNFLALIDDICYYAGDRSVDFDWYARRMAVGSVYKATELYFLQDDSVDNRATWEFLDKSIDLSRRIDGIRSSVFLPPDQLAARTSGTIDAILDTTRNLLGLNWKK